MSMESDDMIQPTPEQLRRGRWENVAVEMGAGHARKVAMRQVIQNPIDRYVDRGEITDTQWRAGCQFRRDWYAGGLEPRVTANTSGGGSTSNPADASYRLLPTEKQVAARARWRNASAAIANAEGHEAVRLITQVACQDCYVHGSAGEHFARLNTRQVKSAMSLLRRGLSALAAHYRMQ
jgi:hypothetical protein